MYQYVVNLLRRTENVALKIVTANKLYVLSTKRSRFVNMVHKNLEWGALITNGLALCRFYPVLDHDLLHNDR